MSLHPTPVRLPRTVGVPHLFLVLYGTIGGLDLPRRLWYNGSRTGGCQAGCPR